MKTATLSLIYCLCLLATSVKSNNGLDSLAVASLLNQTRSDLHAIEKEWEVKAAALEAELAGVNRQLDAFNMVTAPTEFLWALNRKLDLRDELALLEEMYQLSMAKARYRKGLELIKIMYEKTLGLDHHFTSLKTFHNIAQLSNPNAYPEFQQTKDVLEGRLKKENDVKVPQFLVGNPLISATFSLVASFIGEGEPKKKEKDLDKIACILDFTVRMYADLNLIYYETEFLKEGNSNLKADCSSLFKEYTKMVGYKVELDACRKEDDWETLYDMLDKYIIDLEAAALKSKDDPVANRSLMKGIANLEFSIDRLLDFLEKYNNFVAQGEKYYQKFEVIASNYPNEAACAGQLPEQYATLKQDIKFSIEKFREAYNIAELTGSKLKDLLYGTSD
ncbi:MAG: hypothetical protein IT258_18645 [Saprospiraceae bacterium]|nr:hypothetical protein [Saprospiraceae bacterium]